jgi:hypothetical protein
VHSALVVHFALISAVARQTFSVGEHPPIRLSIALHVSSLVHW